MGPPRCLPKRLAFDGCRIGINEIESRFIHPFNVGIWRRDRQNARRIVADCLEQAPVPLESVFPLQTVSHIELANVTGRLTAPFDGDPDGLDVFDLAVEGDVFPDARSMTSPSQSRATRDSTSDTLSWVDDCL